jgi:GDP/UDP-N,N'-diacetylbacillosamine 2-epimerase (hydrolysing)
MYKKILVTTGTRAEYGFLRPVLKQIQKNDSLTLILVVTGTHLSKKHGFTIDEIKKDGFPINAKIKMTPSGNDNFSMAMELGKGIISFTKIFKKFKPDINLILGDRDEMLASALAAYHVNIPNAHIHGGDVSGGLDEYTRHAITKISNIHFAATQKSKNRILKMGENKKFTFFTGSPSIDELVKNKILSKLELLKKYDIDFKGDEIILLYHSVTTEIKFSKNQILKILNGIIPLNKKIIAIFPNSDPGYHDIIKVLIQFQKNNPLFKLYSSLPREDFLGILKNSGALVGNSSSGFIESSYLGIPVVNIGTRQNNREGGKNIINISGNSISEIQKAVIKSLKKNNIKKMKHSIYGNGTSSKKIVKKLETIKINDELLKKKNSY